MKELQAAGGAPDRRPGRASPCIPGCKKIIDDRRAMGAGKLPLDWGMAENLAYASLLVAGYGVRISGEDVGRGTFFHRHAALHDQNREKWDDGTYMPLQHLQEKQAPFHRASTRCCPRRRCWPSSTATPRPSPNELVIWEAQFGDFANGAQVVIDQFITSGEAKWGRWLRPGACCCRTATKGRVRSTRRRASSATCSCAPSSTGSLHADATPAQIFHLLRRQMLRKQRKPLIVMTPKSLLRHKDAVLALDESGQGHLPDGDRRDRRARCEEGDARRACAPARSTTTCWRHGASARSRTSPSCASSSSIRSRRTRLAAELAKYPERQGNRLVSGRAAEPGRLVLRIAPPSRHEHLRKGQTLRCWWRVRRRRRRRSATTAKHNVQQKALVEAALGEHRVTDKLTRTEGQS